jgi:imidazolonepropionase-like amidohydrolase
MSRPPLQLAALAAAAGCACAIQALAASGQSPSRIVPRPIVIIGGTIVDGTGAPARRNDAIVVQDGRIRAIGLAASKRAPKDARVIDASGKWIVPGFIDAAVHLSQTGGLDARPDLLPVPGGRTYAEILADIRRAPAPYLRAYLCAGITSILNLGGPPWTFELREGRADDALSPRTATTGPWIAQSAPAPMQIAGEEGYWVPDEKTNAAALVEKLVRQGPDLVAIRLGSAESGRAADAPLARTAVAEAHARKRRAIVEVVSVPQLRAAVEAGADAVVSRVAEAIPDDLIGTMAKQQTVVVPAMAATESAVQVFAGRVRVEDFERGCAPESIVESLSDKSAETSSSQKTEDTSEFLAGEQRNLQRLVAAGVTIVAGSGAGELRAFHGSSLHREFALMAGAGMTPMQILVSATRDAARLLGRTAEVGQLKEGLAADLVLLDADPMADIRNARKVSVVVKGGALYER